jgi:signal transduction histidine kinase
MGQVSTLLRFRMPLRVKFLVALLLLVTGVMGAITFTMANLFHTDKKTYIHDLTSIIAMHTAQEARSILVGYQERINVFARLLGDRRLASDDKSRLLAGLFREFPEVVAMTLYTGEREPVTVYDAAQLNAAGLTKQDFLEFRRERPIPVDRVRAGAVFVENSTLVADLPILTMAVPQPAHDKGAAVVAAAVIRLDSLLRLARRSSAFESFIVDGRGAVLAHTDPDLVVRRAAASWIPESALDLIRAPQGAGGTEAAGVANEYAHEGVEMVGGFARVDFGGLLAGVQIPRAAAYLTARELLTNLIWVAFLLLVVAAVIGLWWSRLITRSIERLSAATREVAKGDFDVQLTHESADEIGSLAQSFNQMASELKVREAALKQAQAALIQSEKMAAFGQLGAGIAHEVKNPLAGILGYAQLALRKVGKDEATYKHLEIIEKEARRCKSIIESLLRFARQEPTEYSLVDLNRVVEEAIGIVDHQLTINRVAIETRLSPVPAVKGDPNQLQQVLMNLLINAQQAMEPHGGTVRVTTGACDGGAEMRVSDTGPGIPPDVRAKIFEPFFTTKPAGKGTGLGLSVTYGIVHDHRGEIRIADEPGQGATFVVTFPVAESLGSPDNGGPRSKAVASREHWQTGDNNERSDSRGHDRERAA